MAEKKDAEEVMVEVAGRTLKISNLAKVMYPTTGTTKGEVLNYYARVSGVLLPHLAHRAVTRIRWPHGTGDMQFFEKNLPSGAPKWLHSVTVPSTGSRGGGDTISYPVIDDLAELTYFANLASLELHVHQWTVGKNGQPKRPNRMVIDLDPGHPAGLQECCEVALLVRDKLAERGLSSAPVTSGSKGLHLYAALPGKLGSDEVRDQAQEIAQELDGGAPAAGGLEDDQVAARRQGVPRLEPEHRRQDHHLAVLPARARPAVRRGAADLAGDRGRRRRGARAARDGRRAGPRRRGRRHLRGPARRRLNDPVKHETRRSRETAVIRREAGARWKKDSLVPPAETSTPCTTSQPRPGYDLRAIVGHRR